MIRFFVLFTVLLVGLFTLEILQPAEKYVILPFTSLIADISVGLVGLFDDSVLASGNVIQDQATGFGVRIERGCNGLEAVIILFAAIFAFPAPLLLAFLLGSLLEENLRQGLILAFGSPVLFVTSPISMTFLAIAALTLTLPLMRQLRGRRSGNVV